MDADSLESITADDPALIQRAADIVSNAGALFIIDAVVLITATRAASRAKGKIHR